MKLRLLCSAFLLAGLMAAPASAALLYTQDFEGMPPTDAGALSGDAFQVGANVFQADGTTFAYNYFAFPAPNGGPGFSGVATGESGAPQGLNVLNTYNDYNNADHGNGSNNRIQAHIFRDIGVLDAADVGQTYTFGFDVKQGNIGGDTTADAFIKVLMTSDGSFAELGVFSVDTTATGTAWSTGSVDMLILPTFVGETLQVGFRNTADNFGDSGVFYDNLSVSSVVAVPEPSSFAALLFCGAGAVVRRRRRKA